MDPKAFREQKVKDAKCDLILDAARTVFTEKGYLDTRLEDIAAAAGFSKPTLYSYFDDKQTILFSLAIREMEGVLDKIESVIASEGSFLQTLEQVLQIIFISFSKQYSFAETAVGLQNMRSLHMDITKNGNLDLQFKQSMGRFILSIEKIVKQGQSSKEILSKIDAPALSSYILGIVHSVQAQAFMSGKIAETNAVVSQILEFIKHGVIVSNKDTHKA